MGIKTINPGPGTYRPPSDFGYLDYVSGPVSSKNKTPFQMNSAREREISSAYMHNSAKGGQFEKLDKSKMPVGLISPKWMTMTVV